jgi:3D (Asp-Asp-Asp) domain-containing protein
MKLGLRNISSRSTYQTIRFGMITAVVTLVIGVTTIGLARTPESTGTNMDSVPQSALSSQPDVVELLQPITVTPVAPSPVVRIMQMEVTAYCACTKCCGPNAQGITASGKHVSYNDGKFVAADRSIAFGTRLMIPGYDAQPVEVIDRGGAIKGNKLDVFFPTHQEALEWGRRTVAVTVIE